MCVCVCVCVCVVGGEVKRKQRPPTVWALSLTAPPAPPLCPPPVPDPALVCGVMNLYLRQSSVWVQDKWNLAKKGDSSLGGKKGSGPPRRASIGRMLKIRTDTNMHCAQRFLNTLVVRRQVGLRLSFLVCSWARAIFNDAKGEIK